jgi:tetratricopeptide (TPR) repeat protein
MAGFASLSIRQKTSLVYAGLTLLVSAAFWQVARCDFLIYDDWEYVVTNDMVRRGLTAESISWAFQKFHSSNWHPLTWVSHMADVQLYGLQPLGHHVTNLILHTANTLLLLALLQRLTGSLWRSALVAALFAVHPTHVESVAWIAERKDVLSTFFGLLSLLAYASYARTSPWDARVSTALGFARSPAYWLTGLFLALGLMSKPMLVTWPFVMLLLDYWPLNRVSLETKALSLKFGQMNRNLVLEKIPFFALTLGSCVLTFFAQRAGGAVQSLEQLAPEARLANALVSYGRYLGKTFWPADLSIYYPYPAGWSGLVIVTVALSLVALLAIALWQRQQRPYVLFGLCWFLGILVPVIGLVQVGGQSIADRYMYVPQTGLFIVVAWLLGEGVNRTPKLRGLLIGLAVISVIACLGLTRTRVRDWQNSETLFTQALRVTQGNYIAHNNLGLHYLDQKKYEPAIRSFQAALAIRPGYAATHSNLGLALAALNQTDEAIAHLIEALRLKPTLYEARVNLANLYISQSRFLEALELLEEAVRTAPHYPEGHYSLANVLIEQGRLEEATQHAQAALQLRPDYAEALNCLGSICLKQGRFAEAMGHYRRALGVNPAFAEAQSNLALVAATQGKYDEAVAQYEAALRLKPDLLSAHLGLAMVLEQLGRFAEGAEQWAAALKVSPSLWVAHEQMGSLLVKQGKLAEALPHFSAAVIAQPDNDRLHAQYGLALDQLGETRLALAEYRRAIQLNEKQPELLNNLSWILATAAQEELRDGAEAVRHGELACRLTDHREVRFIGTLAAAYAEAGRFAEAVATAQRAIELAAAAGQTELATRNAELLELYRAQKPYHEPAPVRPEAASPPGR